MTDKAISPLRRRLIEDMTVRRLSPKTQHHYIRHVKSFADFLGQSADKTSAEDVHRFQLHLGSIGTTIPSVNAGASALRFFFKVTRSRRCRRLGPRASLPEAFRTPASVRSLPPVSGRRPKTLSITRRARKPHRTTVWGRFEQASRPRQASGRPL
jgi:site-specific recombinase XerD